jgi:hypothetical protein
MRSHHDASLGWWASPKSRALLDSLCTVPDPIRSFEDWERFEHRDISRRAVGGLRIEAARIRTRLGLDPAPDPWFVARYQALTRAIRNDH